MRHGMSSLGAVAAAIVIFGPAHASTVVPLDTFPSSGIPDGPDAGLFARAADGQEIALQFSVNAAGRITQIETGLSIVWSFPACGGWRLGIMSASFIGSTIQPGFYSDGPWLHSVALNVNDAPTDINCGETWQKVDAGIPVTLDDLDWFLEAGDYLLVAAWRSDIEEARWLTNASMLSDQWVKQVIGTGVPNDGHYPCGGSGPEAPWVTLAQCGIAPQPTPTARITFAPGLRVPDPGTLALLSLGLLGLGFTARRRLH